MFLVKIETKYEQYLSQKLGLVFANAKDVLKRKDVESQIPKRVYGTVVSVPNHYIGPKKGSVTYWYSDGDLLQSPTYQQYGFNNMVVVKDRADSHGEIYYESCIQDNLQVGDKVWFLYSATEDPNMIDDGVYSIAPRSVFAYERDGVFNTFAGKVLLEPLYPKSSIIYLPDNLKPVATSGRVAFIGKPLYGGYRTDLLEVGDEVVFPPARRWEIDIDNKTYVALDGEHIQKIIKHG
jgi:co-chaperonin GroES (HSP10)